MNLSRFFLTGAVATMLALGSAGVAQAQDSNGTLRVQKPFRIKLGAYFPTDGSMRDLFGNSFFRYGISYDFAKTRATNPVIYSLFVDGTTRSRTESVEFGGDRFDATIRFSYVGVGPSFRAMLSPATNSTRWYAGLGLGAYFLHRRASVDINGIDVSQSYNDTRFGGKVFGGLEIGKGFFGEVDYTYISEIDGFKPGGVSAMVGYRF